jgi:hypothetical protein
MSKKKPESKRPQEWIQYHQPSPGRVSDHAIVKAIRDMADHMQRYVTDNDIFYSDDLCIAIWDEYGNQHVNMGIRITPLIKKYKLPIRRIGTRHNRALYSIEFETAH